MTGKALGCSPSVRRVLSPELMESADEERLGYELSRNELRFERDVALPVFCKSVKLACGDLHKLVIENLVIVEPKAAASILPVQEAQVFRIKS